MKLSEFNSKYTYKSDNEKFGVSIDVWEDINNTYSGDCESYCIALKRHIPEFSDFNYYYCKINGMGHCVLYKDGQVIDCNIKKTVTYENFCKMFNVTNFEKYNKIVIYSKFLVAWIITTATKLIKKVI